MKKLTLTLDCTGNDPQYPAYQISINEVEAGGGGWGYRLMGPKYAGRSKNLRTVELTQRDADEIRRHLDAVFPPDLKASNA